MKYSLSFVILSLVACLAFADGGRGESATASEPITFDGPTQNYLFNGQVFGDEGLLGRGKYLSFVDAVLDDKPNDTWIRQFENGYKKKVSTAKLAYTGGAWITSLGFGIAIGLEENYYQTQFLGGEHLFSKSTVDQIATIGTISGVLGLVFLFVGKSNVPGSPTELVDYYNSNYAIQP